MDKVKISIQRGLNEIKELLVSMGYDVCTMGKCREKTDIAIVNVPNYEYAGIAPTEMRVQDNKNTFLVNAACYTKEELLRLIKLY